MSPAVAIDLGRPHTCCRALPMSYTLRARRRAAESTDHGLEVQECRGPTSGIGRGIVS
jgi:hypothetical protein